MLTFHLKSHAEGEKNCSFFLSFIYFVYKTVNMNCRIGDIYHSFDCLKFIAQCGVVSSLDDSVKQCISITSDSIGYKTWCSCSCMPKTAARWNGRRAMPSCLTGWWSSEYAPAAYSEEDCLACRRLACDECRALQAKGWNQIKEFNNILFLLSFLHHVEMYW